MLTLLTGSTVLAMATGPACFSRHLQSSSSGFWIVIALGIPCAVLATMASWRFAWFGERIMRPGRSQRAQDNLLRFLYFAKVVWIPISGAISARAVEAVVRSMLP